MFKCLYNKRHIVIALCLAILSSELGLAAKPNIILESDRMEKLNQGEIICFYGNVRLKRDNAVVESDIMKNYKAKNLIIAEENVRFRDTTEKGEVITGSCQKMRYYVDKNYGELAGSPVLHYVNKNNPQDKVDVRGDKIKIFIESEVAEIEGNVRIVFRNLISQSNFGTYKKDSNQIILTGDPHVFEKTDQTQSEYSGDRIILFVSEDKVQIESNVRVKIEDFMQD